MLYITKKVISFSTHFNYSVITSAFESSGDGVNGFRSTSCKGAASLINKPLQECALLLNLNPNYDITVVAVKPKAEIGSPKYRILSGGVLVSDVIL